MTGLEQRLHDAIVAGAQAIEPNPDLFARLQRSVEDQRERRQWRRRLVGRAVLVLAALSGVVFAATDRREGELIMDWWVLEVLTTLGLVAVALVLGPFIKRFGKSYAADVFRANPHTGKSFIVLTDFAYYLIFLAYILFTLSFEAGGAWEQTVNANQVKDEVTRVGGIILIIGLLHSANLLALPVMGRLLSLNRRLDEDPDDGSSGRRRSRPGPPAGVAVPPGTAWVLRIEPAGPGTAVEQD